MAGPFELSIGQWVERTKQNADAAVRGVILEIHSRIVIRAEMPVDTGRLRASFFHGVNVVPTDVPPPVAGGSSLPPPPPLVIEPGTGLGNVHYLASNLKYAARMEFGFTGKDALGREYNQAPRGFVGLTVLEFSSIVNGEIAKARGQ